MSAVATIPLAGGERDRQSGQTDDHDTQIRQCTDCGSSKRIAEFAVDRSLTGGRRSMCCVCRARYDHERYLERTPGESDYKHRAAKFGLPINLEAFRRIDMIDRYGDACVYCRGPFESTDHILCVAAGGPHNLTNVVPCCNSCNSRKYWTVDRHLIAAFRRSRLA